MMRKLDFLAYLSRFRGQARSNDQAADERQAPKLFSSIAWVSIQTIEIKVLIV